jgi:hypothetical protein
LPRLAFNRVHAAAYCVKEDGALLQSKGVHSKNHAAVCAGYVMSAGRHAADVTVVGAGSNTFLGLARPGIDVAASGAYTRAGFWGLFSTTLIANPTGLLYHSGEGVRWAGQQSFGTGDVVGLLLDCDAGTLTVKKNGQRLGVAATGLTGELCWAVALSDRNDVAAGAVRIAAADATAF